MIKRLPWLMCTLGVFVCCTKPTIVTREDVQHAVDCTQNAITTIQQSPANADQVVAKLHVAQEIGRAYGVDEIYVYLNRKAVERAVQELSSNIIGSTSNVFRVTNITYGGRYTNHYRFHGTYGDEEIVLDARYHTNGSCKIMDARINEFSLVAVLVGALAADPAFAHLISDDPYDDL